jgi:hypothetical protein
MINVDLTTKNTVYNTLGAQSQWVQHRFGKRNYPDTELPLDRVLKIVENVDDTINFISVFGDPCSHTNFLKILQNTQTGRSAVNTNLNFINDDIIDCFNQKKPYIVVPLYGLDDLCDKLVLHSNWECIKTNLKNITTDVCVEFYIFDHNLHQVEYIKQLSTELNFDLKLKQGIALHPNGFSPIVNENGVWLYDAYSCDSTSNSINWPDLHKTVNGYNSLIHYVKPEQGKSILTNPNVFKVSDRFTYDTNVSISVTGHVFPSFELHQIFSNALCTDWNFSFSKITEANKMTVRQEFKYYCSSINKILEIIKQDNNILTRDFSDILTNFANSNI